MSNADRPSRSQSVNLQRKSASNHADGVIQTDRNEKNNSWLNRSFQVPRSRLSAGHRQNKIYRCPPTPPPDVQYEKERYFVLDCNAVSNVSQDYSTANPKLGSVIPPYDAQTDQQVDNYFKFFGISKTLMRTGQYNPHESIAGRVHDRFNSTGHAYRYLSLRNKFGSGHSIDQIRGHELFMSDPKPIINYNGTFGYRRNTPSLRYHPTIGTTKLERNGVIPNGRYSVVGNEKHLKLY